MNAPRADGPDHSSALAHLRQADPVMGQIIDRVGACRLDPAQRPHVFHALAQAIIYQQLNGRAAATIFRRFKALYPTRRFPKPEDILATRTSRLRSAGVSPQKMAYLKDLSAKVIDGTVDLRSLHALDDEAAIEHLTQVKGVGRWTAEMVLMFTLGRPDVLPVDDYGFRRGLQVAYRLRTLPEAPRIRKIGEPWRPFRSVGTWYIWQSLSA